MAHDQLNWVRWVRLVNWIRIFENVHVGRFLASPTLLSNSNYVKTVIDDLFRNPGFLNLPLYLYHAEMLKKF